MKALALRIGVEALSKDPGYTGDSASGLVLLHFPFVYMFSPSLSALSCAQDTDLNRIHSWVSLHSGHWLHLINGRWEDKKMGR